jgi:hypothetical protein
MWEFIGKYFWKASSVSTPMHVSKSTQIYWPRMVHAQLRYQHWSCHSFLNYGTLWIIHECKICPTSHSIVMFGTLCFVLHISSY